MRSLLHERGLEKKVYVDSCALSAYHLGEPIHPRIFLLLQEKGTDSSHLCHRARLFEPADLQIFDYIFAVDLDILAALKGQMQDPKDLKKVYLATAFSQQYRNQEMLDPYYGESDGFERTYLMAKDACEGILDYLLVHKEKMS
jgi:protein-tyrosine phosphatase